MRAGDSIVVPVVTGPTSFEFRIGLRARPTPPSVRTVSTATVGSQPALQWRGVATVPAQGKAEFTAIIVERTSGVIHDVSLSVRPNTPTAAHFQEFELGFDVQWRSIRPQRDTDWLDPYIVVEYEGFEPQRVGLARPRLGQRLLHRLHDSRVVHDQDVRFYAPFYTFKARRLAAHVSALSLVADRELQRTRRFLRWRRFAYRRGHRPLWIIGETGYKAQDTGEAFFQYVTRHHPEIDARFVIASDSPDAERIGSVGQILTHGSAEHVRAVLLAERIVSSHHPDYLYPIRTNSFKRSVRATRVFLQHGILGTKWLADLYGRGKSGFEADLFLVSSPGEKRVVERDFDYRPEQVIVTGLTRFDALLAPSKPSKQLLIIPTWRDWITDADSFQRSEFFERWLALISSEEFKASIKSGGWNVRMILHPNFRQFAPDFEAQGVSVIRQGEHPVQELLRESAVLVTDYSSVAFDFALQRRPVVYFQFDRHRFLGARGSHLDLDLVLPGTVAFSESEVVAALRDIADAGGRVSDAIYERATRFFPMMDRRSNDRVFDAVVAARRYRFSHRRLRLKSLGSAVYERWRGSRFYLPVAKALYRTSRLLPLDNNRVVFEAGLGKRYGGSPRAIYERLVSTHPQMRKTWAYVGRIPTDDVATDAVPRMSLRYFFALGRARYLVNNQSFPFYVRRRRAQVLLQTWHGTPLKRMANDLHAVQGRDSGYLERATIAAAQWSVLTSPNHYTTKVMRSAFKFSGRALEVGYPQNDVLQGASALSAAARARRHFSIPEANRIVLFAPTFRDAAIDDVDSIVPTAAIGIEEWLEEFDVGTTLLVRRHILDKGISEIPPAASSRVIDASEYPDVQDLLAAADLLVTDYSSVFFDFLNTRRPIVFFAPDLDHYRDVSRGFYLEYGTDLPGPVATTAVQARALVKLGLEEGRFSGFDLDVFAARYCPMDDGSAAERVVDAVFTGLMKK